MRDEGKERGPAHILHLMSLLYYFFPPVIRDYRRVGTNKVSDWLTGVLGVDT
jgi:hypothetical protein